MMHAGCLVAGPRTYVAQGSSTPQRSNWLKAWALRLAALRGKKRATVALARRIGVVLHRMMVDATVFCFTREEAVRSV